MKKSINYNGILLTAPVVISDDPSPKDPISLLVGLVSNAPEKNRQPDYEFIPYIVDSYNSNTVLVGVEDGERFGLSFKLNNSMKRFAFAAYMDGCSLCQKRGVLSLSELEGVESYDTHNGNVIIGTPDCINEVLYIDTFVSLSGESRRLAFTHDMNKGDNQNTALSPYNRRKIEIFCWYEPSCTKTNEGNVSLSYDFRSAVGAAEATQKSYETISKLNNPVFMGKVTFIYLESEVLQFLGPCTGFNLNPPNTKGKEPMDLVPVI